MFNTRLFKQKRNLYNTLVKNSFVNMSANKKRFTVLNEDKILAVVVKMFPGSGGENVPCLDDKSSRSSYRDRGVISNAWVDATEKLEFLEDVSVVNS